MDIKKIEQIIDLVNKSNVNEIELQEGDTSIRVSTTTTVNGSYNIPVPAAPAAVALPVDNVDAILKTNDDVKSVKKEISGHIVKSPMVGTFYESPSPEADPFVVVGSNVNKGDTLCIVEAMKIMNQIEADKSGVISEILIKDAELVEYNQPLFVIS